MFALSVVQMIIDAMPLYGLARWSCSIFGSSTVVLPRRRVPVFGGRWLRNQCARRVSTTTNLSDPTVDSQVANGVARGDIQPVM
jgi:hypothetical protein